MNPCSETFAGPRAFSEPETKSVARFLRKRGGKFLVYLTLHAYGQYWLTPWGYTYSLPEDIDDLVSEIISLFVLAKIRAGTSIFRCTEIKTQLDSQLCRSKIYCQIYFIVVDIPVICGQIILVMSVWRLQ